MICQRCKHPANSVLDSREVGQAIRRRRQCDNCPYRWTTYETMGEPPVHPRTVMIHVKAIENEARSLRLRLEGRVEL
jgi:transcriptional regulator NrdR family protein